MIDAVTGEAAVLFSDIEGSTALLKRLGHQYDRVLARHHELMREAMTAARGLEVSTDGDAFLVLFQHPADALEAAVFAQRSIQSEPWPGGTALRVRIGIHWGEVRPAADNYVGLGLHQGARVAPAAHGGQVLVTAALKDALAGALPAGFGLLDLGVYHLRDFDEPQALCQVLHPDLPRDFAPLRVAAVGVHNLPPPRTSFVGRAGELSELVKATDVFPLVTLVGPAGAGKTRLACEVGARVAGRFQQGVWLVSLSSVDRSDGVIEHVKSALRLSDRAGLSDAEVIGAALALGPRMVILDNCEHVLDGCVELAELLLASSDTVRVLATTREHLGVSGERVVRLGPLDLPGSSSGELGHGGAVELFVARAAQAQVGFALTPDNEPLVASICDRLDGIPLSLELAAARLSALSLSQLDKRLGNAVELLETGRRGGEERQRTLRSTLAWSHRLLSTQDQRVFAGLSVFRGGFTLAAAAAVVAEPGSAVDDSIEHLVAQSMVEMEHDAEPPRFRLLETMRVYAAEQATAAGIVPSIAARHADHFARWSAILAAREADDADLMAAEHPNLLAALDFLSGSDDSRRHGQLVLDLARFWSGRGHWQLAQTQFARFLDRPDADRELRARVLGAQGRVAVMQADYGFARRSLEEGLGAARELGDRELESVCLGWLGTAQAELGKLDEAAGLHEQAWQIAREIGHKGLESRWVGLLGSGLAQAGDLERAKQLLHQAEALALERSDRAEELYWAGEIGNIDIMLGDFPGARLRYQQAWDLARTLGDLRREGYWSGALGEVACAQGDVAEARSRFHEALDIARRLGDRRLEGAWCARLGGIAVLTGELDLAGRWLDQALLIARDVGDAPTERESVRWLGVVSLRSRDFRAAELHFTTALGFARGADSRPQEAAALASLGSVALAAGRRDEGQALLMSAIELFQDPPNREIGPFEEVLTALSLGVQGGDVARLWAFADDVRAGTQSPRDPWQDQSRALSLAGREPPPVGALTEPAVSAEAVADWDAAVTLALELLRD